MLAGSHVKIKPVTGDKVTRATGFASQVNIGNVRILRNQEWYELLLQRMDAFPSPRIPDDEIDAMADAFNELANRKQLVVGISPDET